MSPDIHAEKRALRAELRERRRTMTVTEREHATEQFGERLRELVAATGARSLSAYLSSTDEPNVRPFLNWAHEQGIRVLLPITRDDGLLDWAVGDGESEREGLFGLPEVVGEVLSPFAIDEVDLILVPAASVDASGMRLGWGRGYFDKTLGSMERRPPAYAVVFDSEFVDVVPSEPHDQPVDGVVTPSAVRAL
ncbi:5-formyltetrahydrofolate cyclo-ligase [Arenivirga flava]|uniref:5-formyltetrahydrofolate cyclo-ligase n=1 Tax=Arenivirga flava TaxID=1930060 RepID=A0AA37XBK2_9MICO|nr:5-formyltetrahydrofolate cyclo-ligase [Arenivirga flava]GMA28440.1 5-formyltetrahydrofolate cyclo-ligase [Arenivirga flava]